MEFPVNGNEESDLVLVDLLGVETRDLAPSASREITILKVLGGKDECGEEHTAPALENTACMNVIGLLHGEVMAGDVWLD